MHILIINEMTKNFAIFGGWRERRSGVRTFRRGPSCVVPRQRRRQLFLRRLGRAGRHALLANH